MMSMYSAGEIFIKVRFKLPVQTAWLTEQTSEHQLQLAAVRGYSGDILPLNFF